MNEDPAPSQRSRVSSALRALFFDVRPLRESSGLRHLLIGQIGSTFSRQALVVLVPLQVYQLTQSVTMLGLVALVQVVPLLICSFVGGMLADLWDRRRLLVVIQIGIAAVNVLFALSTELNSLIAVFVLATVSTALLGMEAPTRSTLIPLLVRPEILPSSFALYSMLNRFSVIIGPAITGFMIAALGFMPAYSLAAIAVGLGALSSSRMPTVTRTINNSTEKFNWSYFTAGLKFIFSRSILRECLLLDFFAMAICMPRVVFPVFGVEVLNGDASTVGLLYSALGIGALLGLLTSGWASRVKRQGRIAVIGSFCWCLGIACFGLTSTLWAAVLALSLAGGADAVSAVMRHSLVQTSSPDHVRGRVTAFMIASFQTGPILGDARAGAMAGLLGIHTSVFAAAIGAAAALALVRPLALWSQRAGN